MTIANGPIRATFSLLVIDSSAKGSPGFLEGTVSSFGDYDQCLAIDDGSIKGQYCMAALSLDVTKETSTEIRDLIENRWAPGNYFEPFVGTCFPDSCSLDDVSKVLQEATAPYNMVLQNVTHCDTMETNSISYQISHFQFSQKIAMFVLVIFVTLALVGTILDAVFKIQILKSFSIPSNIDKLITVDQKEDGRYEGPDYFKIVFTMLTVVMHSKVAAASKNALYNMGRLRDLEKAVTTWWMQPFFNVHALTSMAFVSGLVVSWSILPLAKSSPKFSYRSQVVQRFLKMAPGLACGICMELLWPLFGSGPMYTWEGRDVVSDCTGSWWKLLTFTSNHFSSMEICANHTFYSAVDMQLFVLGLFAIFLTLKNVRWGIVFCIVMVIIDNVMVSYRSIIFDTGVNIASHPIELEKVIRFVDHVHYTTYQYMGAYFIGFLTGLYLRNENRIELGKWGFVAGLFVFNMAGHSIALYNSFDMLPNWFIPYFIIIIKQMYNISMILLVLAGPKSDSQPKAEKLAKANLDGATKFDGKKTNLMVALTRLQYSIYLSNYWYVRWDWFSSRYLFETRANAFFRRFAYSMPYAVGTAFIFHIIFLAPLDNMRKNYFANKSNEKTEKKNN
ncbi:hypothetical protein HDE_04543 [Halotydeus destructor]|nr:hypothetical protein HDE_04543 [Halotydeus destructor]